MSVVSIEIRSARGVRVVPLRPGGRLTIGSRAGAATVAIERIDGLSDVHVAIRRDGDSVVVEDAGSATGTFVNGRRVRRQALNAGDTVTAAGLTIRIADAASTETNEVRAVPAIRHVQAAPVVPQVTAERRVEKAAAPARSDSALSSTPAGIAISEIPAEGEVPFRAAKGERVFAILDLARNRRIHRAILIHPDKHESLYEGERALEFVDKAPYLVEMDPDSTLFQYLRREGWGDSWGIYLTSAEEFPGVRRHLRRFLMVKLPDGGEAYFRFYDPRVFRSFMPVCTAEQAAEMFAAVSAFIAESEDSGRAFRYEYRGRPAPRPAQAPSFGRRA